MVDLAHFYGGQVIRPGSDIDQHIVITKNRHDWPSSATAFEQPVTRIFICFLAVSQTWCRKNSAVFLPPEVPLTKHLNKSYFFKYVAFVSAYSCMPVPCRLHMPLKKVFFGAQALSFARATSNAISVAANNKL